MKGTRIQTLSEAKDWLDAGYVLVPQNQHKGIQPYGTWPDEKPVLDGILADHAAGKTLAEIAGRLATDGARKRNGKPWSRSDVHGVLKTHGGG